MASRPSDRAVGRASATPAQRFAQIFGAVYLLVGILGFVYTGLKGFASTNGKKEIGLFQVNPLANIVHLLVGGAWLASSARDASARAVSIAIGAVYVLLGIVGPFIDNSSANILALNGPDHVLHLVTGLLALYFGLAGRRRTADVA